VEKFVIRGGKPLFGEVSIGGAKNAAVAIIPAAILVDGMDDHPKHRYEKDRSGLIKIGVFCAEEASRALYFHSLVI